MIFLQNPLKIIKFEVEAALPNGSAADLLVRLRLCH
jgi:hypothetical protein